MPIKKPLQIKIYLSHLLLPRGRSYPQFSSICWAHEEEWPNYNIVYLWHEILHILTYNFSGNETILHALIELAVDNELRIQLNKGGDYFIEDGKFIKHKSLRALEEKILPHWQKYLKNKKQNLRQLARSLQKKLGKSNYPSPSFLDHWCGWY